MKTGIWIDTARAIIVNLNNKEENVIEIESDVENSVYHEGEGDKGVFSGNRHSNNEGKFEERIKHQLDDFFDEVIGHLNDVEAFMLFGPAEAKLKLQKKLESNNGLKSKLLAVETTDNMTTNQKVAYVKEFFSK